MTKEVELIIKGIQKYETHEDSDLETRVNAEYFYRGGCHYILYEELPEGFTQPLKNMLKLKAGSLEITRRGPVNTSMVFDRSKRTVSNYRTPFGELLLGITTKAFRVVESEVQIRIEIEYVLEAEEKHMADCRIVINIHAAEQSGI